MIYTHVLKRGPSGVRSTIDGLCPHVEDVLPIGINLSPKKPTSMQHDDILRIMARATWEPVRD